MKFRTILTFIFISGATSSQAQWTSIPEHLKINNVEFPDTVDRFLKVFGKPDNIDTDTYGEQWMYYKDSRFILFHGMVDIDEIDLDSCSEWKVEAFGLPISNTMTIQEARKIFRQKCRIGDDLIWFHSYTLRTFNNKVRWIENIPALD
jgi:hypothetical protein